MPRVAELDGLDLDYWVMAVLDGTTEPPVDGNYGYLEGFMPSADWLIGGPLIEQRHITLNPVAADEWQAQCGGRTSVGPTPLVAAMRALVASRFGDTVPDAAA